jgi:N-acetylglucosamine-6-sulfatase
MRGQGEALDPRFNVNGTRIREAGYVTDLLTDHAVRFIRESGQAPFMAFLAHKALHPNVVQRDDGSTGAVPGQGEGFIAARRHQARYADAAVPRRPSAGRLPAGKPALLRPLDGVPPLGPGTATPDRDIRARLEMLLAVDESLGRIVAALKETGNADRTVIVVMGDHGYFYGEHDLNDERRLAYEESARIPLIVRYPKAARAGATPVELVQTIDVAPTLLELAGVADTTTRQGRSLVPLLRGERTAWRSSVLIEYFSDTVFPRIRDMGYRAVRTERYKYIHYVELDGMDELYDLAADPFEMSNLVGSEQESGLRPALEAELARLQRETGDGRTFMGIRPVPIP